MTNEEWERKVEFIVSQQAQFSADIQELKELHVQAEARMTRMEKVILAVHEDTNARINALVEDTNAKFDALVDSHMRLAESQARTDERLNSFINIVERYISEGQNGATRE